MALTRTVEQFAAMTVTRYSDTPPVNLLGTRLSAELVAAGVPDPDVVLLEGQLVVSTVDDPTDRTTAIETVLANHQGTQHPDEQANRALVTAALAALGRLKAASPTDTVQVRDVLPLFRVLLRLTRGED